MLKVADKQQILVAYLLLMLFKDLESLLLISGC